MEIKIHGLLENSSVLSREDPFLALEKAKEAVRKNNTLCRHRKDHNLSAGNDLTLASQFHLAVTYGQNGMFLDALETYNAIINQKRYDVWMVRIRINMGNLSYLQQNYADAIKMYRMALDQTTTNEKPLRFYIHRTIGNILVEIGKLRDAILDYEAVSMSADADMETCFNLLLCYSHIGDVEKTKLTFLKILTISISSKKNRFLEIDYLESNEPAISAERIEIQEHVRNRNEDYGSLLLIAARLICSMDHGEDWGIGYQWVQGQLTEKHNDISQQIEIERAIQHMQVHEFEPAIMILKSFESKDVNIRAMVATNLSFVYSLEGKLEVADEYADIALASNRFNPNALVNKGNNLYTREKYREATEFYLEAIGLDSTSFEAIYNFGLANVQLGLTTDGLNAFEKLLSIITNDPRVLHHVASLYEHSGERQSALKWFNVLSACLPTDPGVHFCMGNLYAEQEDHAAFQCCLESYSINPSNLDVISWLAIWFVKLEMYEKSISFFKRASHIQPRETKWNFMVASCYRKMDLLNDAFDVYEEVRKRNPQDIDCKRISRQALFITSDFYFGIKLTVSPSLFRSTLPSRSMQGSRQRPKGIY